MQKKKIFISYSHDSEEHKLKVHQLASLLVAHGADVCFDQFDLEFGNDLGLFMEQGLTSSDYIIVICSDLYTQKANQGIGGSGYEKCIITASLMKNVNISNLIPIKMNNATGAMPTFLSSKFYADFDNGDFETNYRALYEQIWNKKCKPRIEIEREYIKGLGRNVQMISETQQSNYRSYEMTGRVTFHYTSNSGNYTIGAGEFEFKTKWSGCGSNSIYAYRDNVTCIGYKHNVTKFLSLSELLDLDYSSRCWQIKSGEVFVLKNRFDYLAIIKVLSVDRENEMLEFEYKIVESLTH